jgi:hypothetical protein
MTRLIPSFACLLLAAGAPLTDQRALIEQALDEPSKIELTGVKLGQAFEIVTEQTGVEVMMPPEVMALIPYGADTLVNASIENIPLRQGLIDLVAPLGMTFEVRDDHVEIVPIPPLVWLGRAATWAELDLLAALREMQPGVSEADLDGLRERIQFQVSVPDPFTVLASAIRDTGAGNGIEVLSVACDKLGWAWTMSGERIIVLSIEQQYRRQLQWSIRVRISNQPLPEAIRRVGLHAGVPIRLEPGALQTLPADVQRHFSLNVNDLSAEEALDMISAYTGLGYLINQDGVLFYQVDRNAAAGPESEEAGAFGAASPTTAAKRGHDPYVAGIEIQLQDGKTIKWLIRESELPEDLKERRQRDIDEHFDALRAEQNGNQ